MAELPRRAVFDTLKGIGIVEVVIHHSMGFSARKYADPQSVEWWAMRSVNRVLHFAIPLFLLVSAALLTASLMKNTDWKRFTLRRAARTLWPYLLWSGIYLAFRVLLKAVGGDAETVTMTYPILGAVTGPRLFVDFPEILRQLLWGKAFYHLYFMAVLIQLAIALPAAIFLMRRWRPSFTWAVAGAAVLQIAAYLLQSNALRVAAPASMILWYIPSLLLGVWIGLNPDEWKRVYERRGGLIWTMAALGLAAYLPMNVVLDLGGPGNSLAFNSAFSLYAVSVALGLLGVAPVFAATRLGRLLAVFGVVSLPIFLIHPGILHGLGGPTIHSFLSRLPVPAIWTTVLLLGISYGLARLAMALKLDVVFFGQRFPRPSDGRSAVVPVPAAPGAQRGPSVESEPPAIISPDEEAAPPRLARG